MINTIMVGAPLTSLDAFGEPEDIVEVLSLPQERTIVYGGAQRFLPSILVELGLFKSTSDIKAINRQRKHLIKQNPRLDLWRALKGPELTEFKVGKQCFWLMVGTLAAEPLPPVDSAGCNGRKSPRRTL